MEFLDGGKWKKHFPVLFYGNMAQLMNLMELLIFPIKLWGGRVSRHPRSGKTEVVKHGSLYVNKHVTCDLSYYSFLIVNCAIMMINNQIID